VREVVEQMLRMRLEGLGGLHGSEAHCEEIHVQKGYLRPS
jgi:hypothetical protein